MGIFNFLKSGKEKESINVMGGSAKLMKQNLEYEYLEVNNEIKDLLWVKNGPYKNYYPPTKEDHFTIEGYTISFTFTGQEEPSLIDLSLPIKRLDNISQVEKLNYFPNYSSISSAQRRLYWEYLKNPYDIRFEIGYVFLFYYGLERHLIYGEFDKAFDLILKLRDIFENKSFQDYSARALIISAMYHNRADKISLFMNSLDKEFEMSMPGNLYILCKYGLGLSLNASEVMRFHKDFEFRNKNYIKRYPDIFLEVLEKNIIEKYGEDSIDISKIITKSAFQRVRKESYMVYANISIENNQIDLPDLVGVFKFKKAMFDLLQLTHDQVKKEIAIMRKNGTLVDKTKS